MWITFIVSAWYWYRFCYNMPCCLCLTGRQRCHTTFIAISVALYCLFPILRWKEGAERTWTGFNMRWEWEVLSKDLTQFRSRVSALWLLVSTYIANVLEMMCQLKVLLLPNRMATTAPRLWQPYFFFVFENNKCSLAFRQLCECLFSYSSFQLI